MWPAVYSKRELVWMLVKCSIHTNIVPPLTRFTLWLHNKTLFQG